MPVNFRKNTAHFTYDSLGNLRLVTLPDGAQIEYLIDPLNRRIGKKKNGQLQYGLIYQDSLRPIADTDEGGQFKSIYLYANKGNAPTAFQGEKILPACSSRGFKRIATRNARLHGWLAAGFPLANALEFTRLRLGAGSYISLNQCSCEPGRGISSGWRDRLASDEPKAFLTPPP